MRLIFKKVISKKKVTQMWASPMAEQVKNPPPGEETGATPWTEEPGTRSPWGRRVVYD